MSQVAANQMDMPDQMGDDDEADAEEAEICLLEHYQGLCDHGKERVAEILQPLSFYNCLRAQTDAICRDYVQEHLVTDGH